MWKLCWEQGYDWEKEDEEDLKEYLTYAPT